MSNKSNVEKVGGESIGETREIGGITEAIKDGTGGDIDEGECFVTTAPSINNKEGGISSGGVMEKPGKLTRKNTSPRINDTVLHVAQ